VCSTLQRVRSGLSGCTQSSSISICRHTGRPGFAITPKRSCLQLAGRQRKAGNHFFRTADSAQRASWGTGSALSGDYRFVLQNLAGAYRDVGTGRAASNWRGGGFLLKARSWGKKSSERGYAVARCRCPFHGSANGFAPRHPSSSSPVCGFSTGSPGRQRPGSFGNLTVGGDKLSRQLPLHASNAILFRLCAKPIPRLTRPARISPAPHGQRRFCRLVHGHPYFR